MRMPFDEAFCAMVEETKPGRRELSFRPAAARPVQAREGRRLRDACRSATTVAEARWLEEHGVDVVIAQGFEAGGHRGMFLSDDLDAQVGTFALVPQVVDAVKVPVIAAGAVSDARGIAAALMLGAAGVQVGSAYLHCPESKVSAPHRAALDDRAGRRHRGDQPDDRSAGARLRQPGDARDRAGLGRGAGVPARHRRAHALRAKAEAKGSGDFSAMWAGQAAALGRAMPAADVTRKLAAEALALLERASAGS